MTAMLTPTVPSSAISPVLAPLLARLATSGCGHATAACAGCAVQVQQVIDRARGTAAIGLDEPALRRLLVRLAEHNERELFALCGTTPAHVYWTGSMRISALAATLTSAPIGAAVEAAAQTCVISFDGHAEAGRFGSGLAAAGRAVDVFRVQAAALAADARRRAPG